MHTIPELEYHCGSWIAINRATGQREAISDARFSVLAFEMSAMKAEHNLDMDWIFKLLCDADDALSILDTNPDALKVAHKRIKSAMKYAQEKGNIK